MKLKILFKEAFLTKSQNNDRRFLHKNYWIKSDGKIIGPIDHSHVGYIIKEAVPKHEINLTQEEMSFMDENRGSSEAWDPVLKQGWIRFRMTTDKKEIDATYEINKVTQQAKKSLRNWIMNNIDIKTKSIWINDKHYTVDEFLT